MLAAINSSTSHRHRVNPSLCPSVGLYSCCCEQKHCKKSIIALEADNNARRAANVTFTVLVPKNLHIAVDKKVSLMASDFFLGMKIIW